MSNAATANGAMVTASKVATPLRSIALASVHGLGALCFLLPPLLLVVGLARQGHFMVWLFASPLFAPPTAIGLWYAWLATQLFRDADAAQRDRRYTERFGGVLGVCLVLAGVAALRAAAQSAARGGGLLGGVGLLPLAAGVVLLLISAASFLIAARRKAP